MGELYEKYQEVAKQPTPEAAPIPAGASKPIEERVEPEKPRSPIKAVESKAPPRVRGVKRNRYAEVKHSINSADECFPSDHLDNADKENTPEPGQIPNPKKRTKTTGIGPSHQVTNPSTVLSPKSSNSRTLPQSPIRPVLGSPQKSHLSRPASPLKPMSPSKQLSPSKELQSSPAKSAAIAATTSLANIAAEKPKATRGRAAGGKKVANPTSTTSKPPATRAKRGAAATQIAEVRVASSSSNVSTTSNATTVMKKSGRPPTAATAVAQKRGVGVSGAGKKIADAPPAGRRVLRKRG